MNPSAGSPFRLNILSPSGRLKEREDGSLKIVLKEVDQVSWVSDSPERTTGTWKPKKLMDKWDKLFGDQEQTTQSSFSKPPYSTIKQLESIQIFTPQTDGRNSIRTFPPGEIGTIKYGRALSNHHQWSGYSWILFQDPQEEDFSIDRSRSSAVFELGNPKKSKYNDSITFEVQNPAGVDIEEIIQSNSELKDISLFVEGAAAATSSSKKRTVAEPMAKPPSDAPVLFDVQSESSTIKQDKDGSYKLVMEDVEKVHWETDDAEAKDGYYSAKKYAKNYDTYYGKDAEVSAYETFTLADGSKEKCKFTITDVKYNQELNKLVYDIEPANKKQADKITGIEGEVLVESAVYSSTRSGWKRTPDAWGVRWRPLWWYRGDTGKQLELESLRWADIRRAPLKNSNLKWADLRWAILKDADLRGADMWEAVMWMTDLRGADLTGALNLVPHRNQLDHARWGETTCPDGSMNVGTQRCSGDQLIPLA